MQDFFLNKYLLSIYYVQRNVWGTVALLHKQSAWQCGECRDKYTRSAHLVAYSTLKEREHLKTI